MMRTTISFIRQSPTRLLFYTACCACVALAADAPKKTGSDYWWESRKVMDEVKALRKADAPAAAKKLEDALDTVADPNVAADYFTTLGEIYTVDIKKPEEAVKVYERALPLFKKPEYKLANYHMLSMLANKTRALVAAKRLDDAGKTLVECRALLPDGVTDSNVYGKYAARLFLQAQMELFEAQDKKAEVNGVLAQFLFENPRYLTLTGKPGDWDDGGWALRELLQRLQSEKKPDEALGWGKLVYRVSAFDKKEIETATKLLNGIWAEQENFPAIAQFNKAQTDPAAPNALVKVAVPELPAAAREALKKKVADLEGKQVLDFGPQKGRDIVTMRLLLGTPNDLREAMNAAYMLLKKRPELQDGSLQVCRVFKAADCNLIRANGFLSFLEGQGENPVPAFLEEMQKKSSGA